MNHPRLTVLADALGAILAGNLLYFLLLSPRLPEVWRHQPFAFDPGLVLDFLLCLGLFGAARWLRARV
ncbi:MAG: hypothetical protein A3D93_01310 [Acidobacteria bacterium RIFCSPHIGHO2_12_FULL_67_30]|nr:MAG: hypothetical protein A3B65_02440 [Acidobacteria bacterium RIFCSPHIGHO2_02_FULL_67_57]OFV85890.1 MAG: hypothetical protein A2620_01205 [Acidobacteria bacterium RIFCSPHIGHO2_01_FULL_67_28]OFV87707.1 MAG: hypothetical protein A3D93_01310 [Acidobacteria bacterium RIFCSPHIGHO2_12_FULL_67_30]